MADTEVTTRPPEQIQITVFRARNLRGNRGDILIAGLKLEFNEKVLGESVKLESSTDNIPEFNFVSNLNCNFEDYQSLDDLANKPLLLNVLEYTPKEKKQRDDKAHLLGQCTFDLYALLKGAAQVKITLPIIPIEGSPLEQIPADQPRPEVDIEISTVSGKPLFSEKMYEECNLLKIVVESLYSPPEALLQPPIGTQISSFTAALPIGMSGDKDSTLVFGTNEVKQPGAFEKTQSKKWVSGASGAQGAAVFMNDSFVTVEPYEKETGQLRDPDSIEARRAAEQYKPIVTWNSEKRVILLPASCKTLADRVARQRVLPIEFFRILQVQGQKGKKDDETNFSHHGVAYIDASPLLFPGVNRIRGAFKIVPFVESEYVEKTNRKTSVLEEALRASTQIVRSGSTKGKKEDKKGGEKGRKSEVVESASLAVAADLVASASLTTGEAHNVEGLQYLDSGSYVTIELELHRALVPRKPAETLAKNVSAYIPSRPLFPKRTVGAQKAVESYRAQVAQIGDLVLEELRRVFGKQTLENGLDDSADTAEQRRRELMYELTANGKFFAFKEQLKYCIVKIVREKYLKTGPFETEAELQNFLSDLYVFLVDEMNVALDEHVVAEVKTTLAPKPIDTTQLKLFADEAEKDGDYELAAKYFEERIAREPDCADHWFDYAVFAMRLDDIIKADQCLRQCLTYDQKHFNGLLLFGIVCALQNRGETAEIYFESATRLQPRSVTAWCITSLYHEFSNNPVLSGYALQEALRIRPEPPKLTTPPASIISRVSSVRRSATRTTVPENVSFAEDIATEAQLNAAAAGSYQNSNQSLYLQTAQHLFALNAFAYAERALAHELVELTNEKRESCEYQIAVAHLHYKRKQYDQAEKFLREAVRINAEDSNGWALLGHNYFDTQRFNEAQESYERVINKPDALDMHTVYLRLADIYVKKYEFEAAKQISLVACKHSPSARTWLGVGIACYRLGELAEAEDALSEANLLNNYDPQAWAYLALVCHNSNRVEEADEAFKYAIKVGLQDSSLFAEFMHNKMEPAFQKLTQS